MTNYLTAQGVQQFSITITSGNTTGTATINAVGSGAFILFGGLNPSISNNPSESFAYLTLTNSTTVTATRNSGSSGTVVITGCIVDGDPTNLINSVQYGTITIGMGASGTTTISSVTNANAAVHLLGWSSSNLSYAGTNENPVLSLSGTTVTATTQSTSSAGIAVGFVVIEFKGSALNQSVQNVSATSSANIASWSATISSVNVNNAICIYAGSNIATVTTDLEEIKQYGSLTSSTVFTATVNTKVADAKTYNCSVVEFVSGLLAASVQRSTTSIAATSTSATSTITSTTPAQSAITWLGNIYASASNASSCAEGAVVLTNATTATVERNSDSAPGVLAGSWEVAEFPAFSGGTTLTIDYYLPGEFQATQKSDPRTYFEFNATLLNDNDARYDFLTVQRRDAILTAEMLASQRSDRPSLLETTGILRADGTLRQESLGTQAVDAHPAIECVALGTVDGSLPSESLTTQRADPSCLLETTGNLRVDSMLADETTGNLLLDKILPDESLTSQRSDATAREEMLATQSSDGLAPAEWVGLLSTDRTTPGELLVSQRTDLRTSVESVVTARSDGTVQDEIEGTQFANPSLPLESTGAVSVRFDGTLPLESLGTQLGEAHPPFESVSLGIMDGALAVESVATQRADRSTPPEAMATQRLNPSLPLESTGAVSITIDGKLQLEFLTTLPRDAATPLEALAAVATNSPLVAETLAGVTIHAASRFECLVVTQTAVPVPAEFQILVKADASLPDEFLASAFSLFIDGLLPFEVLASARAEGDAGVEFAVVVDVDRLLACEFAATTVPPPPNRIIHVAGENRTIAVASDGRRIIVRDNRLVVVSGIAH
jgi:hypothetical protein